MRAPGASVNPNNELSGAPEIRVLKHFQEQMPYGLFVPDVV
jgi:hypothetical protein